MGVCALHRYSPKRHGKPIHTDCGLCASLWEKYLRRQAWKRHERVVASIAGTRRNPSSGSATPGNPGDTARPENPLAPASLFYIIEARQRQTWNVPAWIREVEEKAHGKLWCLELSRPGTRRRYAVMDYDDVMGLLGELVALQAEKTVRGRV